MAFLADFEYDGFVSYAHSQYDCWATAFIAELETLVAGALNTTASSDGTSEVGKLKFWMDPETEGNRPLSDNLKQKVEHSGFIIVLLTQRFLESRWCNRELDWFARMICSKTHGQSLPVFLVNVARTDRSAWPACLRDLPGYDFVGDPQLNTPIGYQGAGQPPCGPEYWEAMRNLAREIVDHLKAHPKTAPALSAPLLSRCPPPNPNGRSQRSCAMVMSAGACRPRLYLAAVPEDGLRLRREAARLLGERFDVVPAEHPRDVQIIREQAAEWARSCDLSVMLLGASSGIWPDDDAGFVVYQYAQIRAAGTPLHCFRAPGMAPIDEIDPGPYRDLLTALNPDTAMPLETFVQHIRGAVRAAPGSKSVYLVSDGDHKLERAVRQLLDGLGAMAFPLPYKRAEARDLAFINREDLVRELIGFTDAILLLNGEGKRTRPEWVHFTTAQLLYRYADAGAGRQLAIVDAPPEPRLATQGVGLPVLAGDCPEFEQQMRGWLESLPAVSLAA